MYGHPEYTNLAAEYINSNAMEMCKVDWLVGLWV
jgi:hypothetical protein